MAVPKVERPAHQRLPDGRPSIGVVVRIVSQNPAIHVGLGWRGGSGLEADITPEQGWVPFQSDIGVMGSGDAHEFLMQEPVPDPLPEWMTIVVTHYGLLGGRVEQVYSWRPAPGAQDLPEGSGSYAWNLMKLRVQPSVAGAKPIEHSGWHG